MRLLIILLALWPGIASATESQRQSGMAPVSTEKRVALVIGNSAYKDAPLRNPVNDAKDMATTLRRLGFDVIEKSNASQKDMNLAIAHFGEKLRADTVALFFYAGHGMQVKGKNYIIPIDAQITSEAAVRAMAVDVDTVMDQLAVSPMNIVILDACRNNPFERKFRSASGGLAQMDAPKGSLIAYATAPGRTAADGESRNGLYTQELLRHIQTPGLPVEAVFKRVRNGVMAASGEAQTPWEASSLTGDFFFRPVAGATSVNMQQAAVPVDLTAVEVAFWENIKSSNNMADFDAYLREYPNGRYAALAQVLQQKLQREAAEKEAQDAVRREREAKEVERQRLAAEAAESIDLSGTWSPEHAPGDVYIFPDGTCTYKGFLIITIGCKWNRPDSKRREFILVWNHGFTDVMTLSADGQRLIGKNNVGDPVSFVRKK